MASRKKSKHDRSQAARLAARTRAQNKADRKRRADAMLTFQDDLVQRPWEAVCLDPNVITWSNSGRDQECALHLSEPAVEHVDPWRSIGPASVLQGRPDLGEFWMEWAPATPAFFYLSAQQRASARAWRQDSLDLVRRLSLDAA